MNSKPEDERKTVPLPTRLTAKENNLFKKYCEKNSTNRSRLNRKIIREIINKQPDLLPSEMVEFKNAVRQLAGISRNLNQITRKVNSGKCPSQLSDQKYWESIGDYVKDVRQRLDDIIDKTENRWVNQ